MFENNLNNKIFANFEKISSKQQTGFPRGFNALHCLLIMLEQYRKALDKGGRYAALVLQICQKHMTARIRNLVSIFLSCFLLIKS